MTRRAKTKCEDRGYCIFGDAFISGSVNGGRCITCNKKMVSVQEPPRAHALRILRHNYYSVRDLMKETGVGERTIRRWLSQWSKEYTVVKEYGRIAKYKIQP